MFVRIVAAPADAEAGEPELVASVQLNGFEIMEFEGSQEYPSFMVVFFSTDATVHRKRSQVTTSGTMIEIRWNWLDRSSIC